MGHHQARATNDSTETGERRGSAPAHGHAALLWLACAAQFMVVLDVSVVNVALPRGRRRPGLGAARPASGRDRRGHPGEPDRRLRPRRTAPVPA